MTWTEFSLLVDGMISGLAICIWIDYDWNR